ncbi:hypothetical protein ACWGBJ_44410, partial [Streptomyces sp. NPDC054951]
MRTGPGRPAHPRAARQRTVHRPAARADKGNGRRGRAPPAAAGGLCATGTAAAPAAGTPPPPAGGEGAWRHLRPRAVRPRAGAAQA